MTGAGGRFVATTGTGGGGRLVSGGGRALARAAGAVSIAATLRTFAVGAS